MSKITFSEKINDMMNFKIGALENLDYTEFLKKDEYFELVLCLAYMTLSKEKIIQKDIKNTMRLDRLTKMVPTIDIDTVFEPNFSVSMPNIIYTKENNNTWILDNIRDSIMHGTFEIDEDKKCLIIDNTQFDRELKVEIPFSWFISYAKYDILSKKITDKYTIRGFYYNQDKKGKTYLNTKKEIINNILYNVNITGNKFNIKDIAKRVKEIFAECSKTNIDDSLIEKYRKRINSEKIIYNQKYLVSFYIASEIVKEKIEQEFPGVNVNIYINNRKNKLANKLSKKTAKYYKNYDLMYEQLNNLISSKSMSLLNYISNIIEILDNIPEDSSELGIYEKMNLIEYILKGEIKKYEKENDIYACFDSSINILRSICFNIYGLATLVINHDNLYNSYFLDKKPSDYNLLAYTSQNYLDYATKEKSLRIKILEKEIKLFEKQEQLKGCTNKDGIIHVTNSIKTLLTDIKQLEENLHHLATDMNFKPYINESLQDIETLKHIYAEIDMYYDHFRKSKTSEGKKKVKKVIGKILDKKISEESKYTYGICNTMNEALTIIRNSLSHIGRIYIGKNRNQGTIIILNDYDSNNKQSGAVIGRYKYLMYILSMPFYEENNHSKKLTKSNN